MMLETLSSLTFLQKLTKLQKFNSTSNATVSTSRLGGCKLQLVDKFEKKGFIDYESGNSKSLEILKV